MLAIHKNINVGAEEVSNICSNKNTQGIGSCLTIMFMFNMH